MPGGLGRYIPGSSLKGLIHHGVKCAEGAGQLKHGNIDQLFGETDSMFPKYGCLMFSDASYSEMGDIAEDSASNRKTQNSTLISAGLNRFTGGANGFLMKIEMAPPATLKAVVTGPDNGEWIPIIEKCLVYVNAFGCYRDKGYGQCRLTLESYHVIIE
jgi:hypothetical protein